MAVTLTVADLREALRLGGADEEERQARRLLRYSRTAVQRHAPEAPAEIQDEAVIRLAGYLLDMPYAPAGVGYANAGRNSGAWSILLPYRVHRAGKVREEEEVEDMGAYQRLQLLATQVFLREVTQTRDSLLIQQADTSLTLAEPSPEGVSVPVQDAQHYLRVPLLRPTEDTNSLIVDLAITAEGPLAATVAIPWLGTGATRVLPFGEGMFFSVSVAIERGDPSGAGLVLVGGAGTIPAGLTLRYYLGRL